MRRERGEDPQLSRARKDYNKRIRLATTLMWEGKKELKTKENKQKGWADKEKEFLGLTF